MQTLDSPGTEAGAGLLGNPRALNGRAPLVLGQMGETLCVCFFYFFILNFPSCL